MFNVPQLIARVRQSTSLSNFVQSPVLTDYFPFGDLIVSANGPDSTSHSNPSIIAASIDDAHKVKDILETLLQLVKVAITSMEEEVKCGSRSGLSENLLQTLRGGLSSVSTAEMEPYMPTPPPPPSPEAQESFHTKLKPAPRPIRRTMSTLALSR